MQIIIEPLVTEKQTALFDALIDKGYFATEKAARAYLKSIQNFILSLPRRTAWKTKNDSMTNILPPTRLTAALPGTSSLI